MRSFKVSFSRSQSWNLHLPCYHFLQKECWTRSKDSLPIVSRKSRPAMIYLTRRAFWKVTLTNNCWWKISPPLIRALLVVQRDHSKNKMIVVYDLTNLRPSFIKLIPSAFTTHRFWLGLMISLNDIYDRANCIQKIWKIWNPKWNGPQMWS